jgi:lysophospholipase L1-like esterase
MALQTTISSHRKLVSLDGVRGLARIERDVLSQTGIRAVILLEGVNDLLHPEIAARGDKIKPCVIAPQASAEDLIAAYRQIAAQVHARGLKIYAGTILPFQGFTYWTPAHEARRQAVNKWMKSSGVFDGVIDFASAVSDAGDPSRLSRGKDSGDHLHPNDAGYASMGNAIDLAMILGR